MFDITTFTGVHTWISIVALATGLIVMTGLLGRPVAAFWTPAFLLTAIATSATGFGFPFNGVLPSHIVGGVALLVLVVVLLARYGQGLAGRWRTVEAVGMVASVYLLVFVAIAQAFMKVPALHRLAPTGSEPPFAVAQAVVLGVFVWLGVRAVRMERAPE